MCTARGLWYRHWSRFAAEFRGFRRFKGFKGEGIAFGDEYIYAAFGSENHKTGPAARRKCTPIPAYGGTSPKGKHVTGFSGRFTPLQIQFLCHPGGGSLLSAFLSANLCRSFYSAARISPSGGDAAAGGRRGAFPSPARAVVWFYPYWRRSRPPQPSRLMRVKL